MNNRKRRIEIIVELIRNQSIGSQEELAALLEKKGHTVTQATLSRDLKMLRTTKVPTDRGYYRYMLPENNEIPASKPTKSRNLDSSYRNSLIGIRISGNIAVIKTRNGYASGVAYDIDMSGINEIIGTIPGTDTILAVMREGVDFSAARNIFSTFFSISPDLITK